MTKYKIEDYDVFIFDFDGTILDTECFHYQSYLKSLQDFNENINISENDFFEMVHNTDKTNFHNFLKSNNINYDELYQKKSDYYKQNIINNHIKYVGNIDIFLEKLKKKQKKLIMVTNSSIKSIDLLKISYPIINLFDKIYTKEDFTNKKPHPECYLKVQEVYKNSRMIGFEDSYQGMHALSQALNIKSIHIRPRDYYYNDFIKNNYNVEIIDNYNCFD